MEIRAAKRFVCWKKFVVRKPKLGEKPSASAVMERRRLPVMGAGVARMQQRSAKSANTLYIPLPLYGGLCFSARETRLPRGGV